MIFCAAAWAFSASAWASSASTSWVRSPAPMRDCSLCGWLHLLLADWIDFLFLPISVINSRDSFDLATWFFVVPQLCGHPPHRSEHGDSSAVTHCSSCPSSTFFQLLSSLNDGLAACTERSRTYDAVTAASKCFLKGCLSRASSATPAPHASLPTATLSSMG